MSSRFSPRSVSAVQRRYLGVGSKQVRLNAGGIMAKPGCLAGSGREATTEGIVFEHCRYLGSEGYGVPVLHELRLDPIPRQTTHTADGRCDTRRTYYHCFCQRVRAVFAVRRVNEDPSAKKLRSQFDCRQGPKEGYSRT